MNFMVYPIVIYGSSVLRRIARKVNNNYENLHELIEDLFETMYKSDGVGLAAPQIGKSLRLIVIDTSPMAEDDPSLANFKKVLINPTITEETGEEWAYNEGCLSIPDIREDVLRKPKIKIEYYDKNFNFYQEQYDGIKARVIQHECDHLNGILFTDRISPIKKRMLKAKLHAISKGKFEVNYKVKLPK